MSTKQDFKPKIDWHEELNVRRQSWVSDEGLYWLGAVVAVIAFCLAAILGQSPSCPG